MFLPLLLKGVSPKGRSNRSACSRCTEYSSDHGLSPYKLHLLGIMFLAGRSSQLENLKIGLKMLQTASESGYLPSTLAILRFLHSAGGKSTSRVTSTRLFRTTETILRGYLARTPDINKDPNACTVAGLIASAANHNHSALQWFNVARKVGSVSVKPSPGRPSKVPEVKKRQPVSGWEAIATPRPREARWAYEPSCLLGLGRICLKLGRREEAEDAFRTAALVLDYAAGYAALADMLPEDAPDREMYLTKAASSGAPGAAGMLSRLEFEKAERASSEDVASEHFRIAEEWRSIAAVDPGAQMSAGT